MPGAGILLRFQRKHSLSAWSNAEASLRAQSSQFSERRLKSERVKNPNRRRSLGTLPHKAFSDIDGRRSHHAAFTHPTHPGLRRKPPHQQSHDYGCSLFWWPPSLFCSMFPCQSTPKTLSSSARTCLLYFGLMGTSLGLFVPELSIFSHDSACRAGAGGVGLGWTGTRVSHPWDHMQVGFVLVAGFREVSPHRDEFPSHPKDSLQDSYCKPVRCEAWDENEEWQ